MATLSYVRIIRIRATTVVGGPRKGRPSKAAQPIPNGSWIEGTLIKPIHIGKEFRVRCVFFDGKACLCGRLYQSSCVISIHGDQVITRQVVYKVMRVPRFDPQGSLRAWE